MSSIDAPLTDAQYEVYRGLTRRNLLVLDTEYTDPPRSESDRGSRLISYALVPIIRGQRSRSEPLYREMNPGVPISSGSTKVHGFTDADVAQKRSFAHHGLALLEALNDPDAVLVTHTGADVRVLRGELERLNLVRVAAGESPLALPLLPLLDSSLLPRLVKYPGVGSRGILSLATLCELTGVGNNRPHHAIYDARATADALVQVLRHISRTGVYLSIEDLLADHDQGTTHEPRSLGIIRRKSSGVNVPAVHLARHTFGLPDKPTATELDTWVEVATECATLRCSWLRDETTAALSTGNAAALRDRLTDVLPTLTEPGQSSTLLGALVDVVTPRALIARAAVLSAAQAAKAPPLPLWPGLPAPEAMAWYADIRDLLTALPACDPTGTAALCPDCQAGRSCPRDVLYQPVAWTAMLGVNGTLNRDRIKNHLFGKNANRYINAWTLTQPQLAAYMAWLVIEQQRIWAKGSAGGGSLEQAMGKNLHLLEPRLALLACEAILTTTGQEAAVDAATEALGNRTTDEAWELLVQWRTFVEQSSATRKRNAVVGVDPHPRRGRPKARRPVNPYLP